MKTVDQSGNCERQLQHELLNMFKFASSLNAFITVVRQKEQDQTVTSMMCASCCGVLAIRQSPALSDPPATQKITSLE